MNNIIESRPIIVAGDKLYSLGTSWVTGECGIMVIEQDFGAERGGT